MSERHPLARRLDDGRILLRYSAIEPDGTRITGSVALGPEHPAYTGWDAELTRWESTPEPSEDSIEYEPIDFECLPMFRDSWPNQHD